MEVDGVDPFSGLLDEGIRAPGVGKEIGVVAGFALEQVIAAFAGELVVVHRTNESVAAIGADADG